ncbi:hypothetical protein JVT61DRAFT_15002 [Boletus reticuloceps]|uniref:Uncharacterized protein n=1 Tax=Boletus reticuloceps TaxID=495285 RepID=A0A8I2YCJ3_9AGAM|nr:hypothetical protein JVT61DRAFT_15002 [Boletus reticuloceps]
MKMIEPEHIAYAAMQACFMISSAEKWSDQNGLFNYPEFYYRIIWVICKTRDRTWANSLIEWYNEIIFGNPKGLVSADTAIKAENVDNDLLEMEQQFEKRKAGEVGKAGDLEFPSRPPTPFALVDLDDVVPANLSSANHAGDAKAPNKEDGTQGHCHVDQQDSDVRLSDAADTHTTSNRSAELAIVTQQVSVGPPSSTSTSGSATIVGNASPGPGPSTLKK